MNGGTSGRRPLRELADAVGMLTGWGSLGGGGDDDGAPPRQLRGPGVLAIQSVIMIGVAAVLCLVKIVFYGDAAGWLAVLVPLAVPVALATTHRPPRLALGLTAGGLAAAAAGLLAVFWFRDHLTGFWLAFLGLSVASLVAGTVFGFVTAAPWRTSA